MRQDYRYVLTAPTPRLTHGASETIPYQRHLKKALPWALGAGAMLTIIALLLPSKEIEASVEAPAKPLLKEKISKTNALNFALALPELNPTANHPAPKIATASQWQQMTIGKGDTFGQRAQLNNISAADIAVLSSNPKIHSAISRVYPGQVINFKQAENGDLLALAFDVTETSRLSASRENGSFTVKTIDRPFTVRENRASGVINSSMYGAALKSGMSDNTIMQLAEIFGYDIDFSLDIREGDRFNVIWDEYYRDGVKVKDGDIRAAEFINDGRVVRAVRFTDKDGRTDYFTPEGKSLKKAFLRSPVHFTRISSQFNLRRLHPKFNKIRPHRGVDYAAPTGTPIFASGDGKVIFRGQKNGYGNVIILQHPGNRYTTLYAHMSKFNSSAQRGKYVKQGQVIGYVGATGWATGPHLHYEFRKNNVHVNPLTVKLPTAQPLSKQQMPQFLQANSGFIDQLNIMNRTQLAQLSK